MCRGGLCGELGVVVVVGVVVVDIVVMLAFNLSSTWTVLASSCNSALWIDWWWLVLLASGHEMHLAGLSAGAAVGVKTDFATSRHLHHRPRLCGRCHSNYPCHMDVRNYDDVVGVCSSAMLLIVARGRARIVGCWSRSGKLWSQGSSKGYCDAIRGSWVHFCTCYA